MTRFRNDPHWQQYWQDRQRNEKVSMYAFAPFFELVGILLRAVASVEPNFRRRRASTLLQVAYSFDRKAEMLRQQGIGWMTNSLPSVSPLTNAIYTRYHHNTPTPESTGVVAGQLLSSVIDFLFLFEETFLKIEKELGGGTSGISAEYVEHLETLVDLEILSGQVARQALPSTAFSLLGRHAIMLECEGLAYSQAMVEDGFFSKSEKKKKKRCTVPDDALQKLAEDIGVSEEVLREVFETENSGWWAISEEYKRHASIIRDEFIHILYPQTSTQSSLKDLVCTAWDVGSVTLSGGSGYPYCSSEDACIASEQTTKLLIAMFLSFPDVAGTHASTRSIHASRQLLKR